MSRHMLPRGDTESVSRGRRSTSPPATSAAPLLRSPIPLPPGLGGVLPPPSPLSHAAAPVQPSPVPAVPLQPSAAYGNAHPVSPPPLDAASPAPAVRSPQAQYEYTYAQPATPAAPVTPQLHPSALDTVVSPLEAPQVSQHAYTYAATPQQASPAMPLPETASTPLHSEQVYSTLPATRSLLSEAAPSPLLYHSALSPHVAAAAAAAAATSPATPVAALDAQDPAAVASPYKNVDYPLRRQHPRGLGSPARKVRSGAAQQPKQEWAQPPQQQPALPTPHQWEAFCAAAEGNGIQRNDVGLLAWDTVEQLCHHFGQSDPLAIAVVQEEWRKRHTGGSGGKVTTARVASASPRRGLSPAAVPRSPRSAKKYKYWSEKARADSQQ